MNKLNKANLYKAKATPHKMINGVALIVKFYLSIINYIISSLIFASAAAASALPLLFFIT